LKKLKGVKKYDASVYFDSQIKKESRPITTLVIAVAIDKI
jgi:hypothetical protein